MLVTSRPNGIDPELFEPPKCGLQWQCIGREAPFSATYFPKGALKDRVQGLLRKDLSFDDSTTNIFLKEVRTR